MSLGRKSLPKGRQIAGTVVGKSVVDIEELKPEIVERLRPLDPERVILFGSYAHGNLTEDSDIDLYVVTKDEFVPRSFREKADLRLKLP